MKRARSTRDEASLPVTSGAKQLYLDYYARGSEAYKAGAFDEAIRLFDLVSLFLFFGGILVVSSSYERY